jgi:hypothetical protein
MEVPTLTALLEDGQPIVQSDETIYSSAATVTNIGDLKW